MLKAFENRVRKGLVTALLILPLFAVVDAFCQKEPPDVTVSIHEENISLEKLLTEISEQTGLSFSYNPRKIPVQSKTSYNASKKDLYLVLQEICSEFGLTFTFVENQIVLKPDKESGKIEAQTFTISGYIRDANSGEALIGASVFVREIQTGTITNPFGFYSLTIPKGTYTITYSFIGFAEVKHAVDLNQPMRRDLTLNEQALVGEAVVVSSIASLQDELMTGNSHLRPSTVEERPEIFGEVDVVKSLESVPGVKFHSDGSTFYYVRGGHRDQNLVFIDDAPIYNPSHALGIFSTIIPDAVNDITLYKGNMPASMGGRLSSVLDVRTRKGNDQHFSGWGNLGLISTKIGIEGPFKRSTSSYLLSGRFSSLQWFIRRANENIEQFNFHDLTGKVNFRLNENNRLYFSFYSGADNYSGENNGIAWTNNAATLQWNHIFNDRLFLNTTITGGGYDYFLHTDLRNDVKWNSHISNFNIKTDFSFFARPENEVTFGAGVNGYAFNPGNLLVRGHVSPLPVLSVKNSLEFVVYVNQEVRVNEAFGINYGVRFSSWHNLGEAFEFIFDERGFPVDTMFFERGEAYKLFLNAEPRLTVSYFIGDSSSLKLGYSGNVQNIHLVSNSISPFTSLDVWLPSSFNIRPQRSRQLTLGYYHTGQRSRISGSVEGFWKGMSNQIDYDAHARTLLNPLLESELKFGRAWAYGVEVIAKRDEGRLRGWVGYTWSRAKRKFADINDGRIYNAFYDRPHQASLLASYDVSTRWQLGANWTYSTGSAYSSPLSFYSYNGEEIPLYGQKNNARLPDYHRLDISATYRLNRNPENRFEHNLSFSIFNFYDRKNPLFVNFNKTEADDGSLKVPGDVLHASRVTSRYYLFGFTPSVSYNFKWL